MRQLVSMDHITLISLMHKLPEWIKTVGGAGPIYKEMTRTLDEVTVAVRIHELMERSTVLQETDAWIAYEHPDKGDEAPIMLWDKKSMIFYEDSGIWDCEDPQEISDWLYEMALPS